jgi:hypothetical protein
MYASNWTGIGQCINKDWRKMIVQLYMKRKFSEILMSIEFDGMLLHLE